jgi:hypothetical protein
VKARKTRIPKTTRHAPDGTPIVDPDQGLTLHHEIPWNEALGFTETIAAWERAAIRTLAEHGRTPLKSGRPRGHPHSQIWVADRVLDLIGDLRAALKGARGVGERARKMLLDLGVNEGIAAMFPVQTEGQAQAAAHFAILLDQTRHLEIVKRGLEPEVLARRLVSRKHRAGARVTNEKRTANKPLKYAKLLERIEPYQRAGWSVRKIADELAALDALGPSSARSPSASTIYKAIREKKVQPR